MIPRVTGSLRLSVILRFKSSRHLALSCVHRSFVGKYGQYIASNSQFETSMKRLTSGVTFDVSLSLNLANTCVDLFF